MAGRFEYVLILLRQLVKRLVVDEQIQLRPAFPPAGVVVKLGDFIKAEFFVVIRPHPLRRVDGAFFQRGINVAAGNLLRHHAEFLQRQSAGAADAKLEPFKIGHRLDLFAKPAAHLRTGIAGAEADDVVFLEKIIKELTPAAVQHPRILLARCHAERYGCAEGKRRVFAEKIIRCGMRALHGGVLHGIHHAERRHDFAAGEYLDPKFIISGRRHALRNEFRAAEYRVQAFRKTRRQTPLHLGCRLRECGCRCCGKYAGQAGMFYK